MNDLIKAADELADAANDQWTVYGACPKLINALKAYRTARENVGEVKVKPLVWRVIDD